MEPKENIVFQPIGIIHSPFTDKKETPIQGVYSGDARGTVEIFPEYKEGLKDIEGFSHLFLLFHFHRAGAFKLCLTPFLEDREHGIFAIRHFNRPNPIGLSIVTLLGLRDNILDIGEVDILDGTPLLDIKPYVPKFDARVEGKGGWVENPEIDHNRGKPGMHRGL